MKNTKTKQKRWIGRQIARGLCTRCGVNDISHNSVSSCNECLVKRSIAKRTKRLEQAKKIQSQA